MGFKFEELSCLTSVLPGDTSDSRNYSFKYNLSNEHTDTHEYDSPVQVCIVVREFDSR